MRRTYGPRAPTTIEAYELLAELYTSTALSYQAKAEKEKTGPLAIEYFKKALAVHEDILRLVVHEHGEDEDSDEEDTTASLLEAHGISVNGSVNGHNAQIEQDESSIDRAALALRHLHLMKLAYQRLGSWPKSYKEYEKLNAEVFRTFGAEEEWKGVQGVEKWNAKEFGAGKAESNDGAFEGVESWAFVGENDFVGKEVGQETGVTSIAAVGPRKLEVRKPIRG